MRLSVAPSVWALRVVGVVGVLLALLAGVPEGYTPSVVLVAVVLVGGVLSAFRPAGVSEAVSRLDHEQYVELVLRCVESVPRGRVTTYGAIAEVVGAIVGGGGPRLVGTVMATHRRPPGA